MPAYGHAGDGNIHVNFLWNDASEKPKVDRAVEAMFKETIALGGTLSGEHGIGILKAPYLPLEQTQGRHADPSFESKLALKFPVENFERCGRLGR